jgi:SnoaL-like polyketide cyclase
MVDREEDLVRRYYGEALNPGRFELLDDLLTADFLDHEELRGVPPTRDGLKQKYAMLRAGFPDFGFTVEDPVQHGRSGGRAIDCPRHSRRGVHGPASDWQAVRGGLGRYLSNR